MKRIKVGAITFCIVFILNKLFGAFPGLYELLYFRGLYQLLHFVHDYTIGFLPIPNIYIIAPLFFFYFFRTAFSSLRAFLFSFITCFLWIINLFYLLWGFNYNQEPISERLALTSIEVDSIYIKKEFLSQTRRVNKLAGMEIEWLSFTDAEKIIRKSQEELLASWGVPVMGRVRVRKIIPGILLHLRTTGIYIPHSFEGHVDGGMFYKQHPFTLAHEMAHGYGFTDESVCNFIAYYTALNTKEPSIIYSAELAYWRYLSIYYRKHFPKAYSSLSRGLYPAMRSDLEEIRSHIEKYPDWLPDYRDQIYDSYLKRHGVEAGIQSYNEMIYLIAAYKNKQLTLRPQ